MGARLKYCLANGTKEHLVAHPSQWPGVHSAKVFCKSERMVGKWTDYTALAAARKRDPNVPESDFQTEYEVVHSKMPSLDHLSDEDYRALMVSWCDEAATDAAAVREAGGLPEPGLGEVGVPTPGVAALPGQLGLPVAQQQQPGRPATVAGPKP